MPANDYYNHGSTPINRSLGSSALMRTEFDNITAGFALVAPTTGNSYKLAVINAAGTAQTVSAWTIYGPGNLITNANYGYGSMAANTTGANIASFGYMSLAANIIGVRLASYGSNALLLSTGDDNTGIGASAGATTTSGTKCTFVGSGADTSSGTGINRTAIGYGAVSTADNQVMLGDANVTKVKSAGAYESTIATGTPPIVVASTTVVPNLYVARAQVADLVTVAVWVSGTTYAVGNVVYSPIDFKNYRRKTNGAGTTDPSADSTNWAVSDATAAWLTAAAAQSNTIFNGGF